MWNYLLSLEFLFYYPRTFEDNRLKCEIFILSSVFSSTKANPLLLRKYLLGKFGFSSAFLLVVRSGNISVLHIGLYLKFSESETSDHELEDDYSHVLNNYYLIGASTWLIPMEYSLLMKYLNDQF